MIYRLFTERLPDADTKWLWLAALVFTAALSALALRVFKNKLPRDKGREFAVDGALSAGKVRGAGIVFVCCFIISALLFVPVTLEYVFYYILKNVIGEQYMIDNEVVLTSILAIFTVPFSIISTLLLQQTKILKL